MTDADQAITAYGERYGGPDGFLARLRAGTATEEELEDAFLFDRPPDSDLPNAGVYTVIRFTPYLLCAPFGRWTERLVEPVGAGREVRDYLLELVRAPGLLPEQAEEFIRNAPRLQELVVRGLLRRTGLQAADGWVQVARQHLCRGIVVDDILVHHLREADIVDVRLFLDYYTTPPDFNAEVLMASLGYDGRKAAAYACSKAAPELMLYQISRFNLNERDAVAVCNGVLNAGFMYLRADQQLDLVNAPWLPVSIQDRMREDWDMPPRLQ